MVDRSVSCGGSINRCGYKMALVTEEYILGIKKRFWLYIVLGVLALLVLVFAPQGQYGKRDRSSTWQNIIPSGLYEPMEDGSSYGYSDRCGDDTNCRSCKANIACLSCMNDCYNRHGPFYRKSNPRLAASMLCNDKCIDEAAERAEKSVDADLRFARPDK